VSESFEALFERATGAPPYPYQTRLADRGEWPVALSAPTGAGKTAAVVMAWLHRRRNTGPAVAAATPRRLVFCMPMRTLVSQTVDAATRWFKALGCFDDGRGLDRRSGVAVHALMGGAVDDDWHVHPEQDAVLVGTQDMLLSRALNRGYASSRFHWPWEYALLANDCLWVFDEVQLMGVGLATGLQLQALRAKLTTWGPSHSIFMSATMERTWLETVDHPAPGEVFTLSDDDRAAEALTKRRCATKRLECCSVTLTPGDKASVTSLASKVLAKHVQGTRTLVIVNRVETAVSLHAAIVKGGAASGAQAALLHSRFRPADRDRAVARATAKDFAGIVVATQVVEAGVDMTSRTLFTELAPWPSMVQRAGRCNRGGEETDATVVWVDHPSDDKAREKASAPYGLAELDLAKAHLREMTSFNPEAVERRGVVIDLEPAAHVVRRRDVIDLFDTTPDLAGADLDVSRFIREGDERDVRVFWRDVDAKGPDPKAPRPRREELCAVPIGKARDWIGAPHDAWRWNAVEGEWEKLAANKVFPGLTVMLRAKDGGYDPERGWDEGQTTKAVEVVVAQNPKAEEPEEAMDDDRLSDLERWVDLATHSTDARDAAREIVAELQFLGELASDVVRSAHAHDLGKAHEVFQETMRGGYEGELPGPWAKSGSKAKHSRKGFRHELASALAWLLRGDERERDLVAYLLAAHHGKVRLSIRALPNDETPEDRETLHARGVFDGDVLPAADLGDGLAVPETKLSLEPMRIGRSEAMGASWMDRAATLRERFGPFRLAYLEALVRAADVRASMREAKGAR
jgi:CRISPR-associated endonuclease/helicase Cas3